jgi:cystathionine beta-lyase
MEVQDVPAIVQQAHAQGALVVLDNTWSSGIYFDAFAHGVDITMQALTKYVGGHSDLLLGSVTTRDKGLYEKLGDTYQGLGAAPSPDDCSLALRGMKTLAVRLKAVEESALAVAQWLQQRPEVQLVLHPALPSCPGHEFWKRDFTGSSGLFSIVFREQFTKEQVIRFVNALQFFKIGYSWGGVASLVMLYGLHSPKRPAYGSRLVRLYVGLESVDDLKADLTQALEKLK